MPGAYPQRFVWISLECKTDFHGFNIHDINGRNLECGLKHTNIRTFSLAMNMLEKVAGVTVIFIQLKNIIFKNSPHYVLQQFPKDSLH